MTKINDKNLKKNKLRWAYLTGFFIILALPILVMSPYFFPVDWGKTIVFRSVLAVMLFLCLWQFLRGKEKFDWKIFIKNKIVWTLGGLFAVYLLATVFSVDINFSLWGSPYRGGGFVDFGFLIVFSIMAFWFFQSNGWQPAKSSLEANNQAGKKAWGFSIIIGFLVSLVGIAQYYGWFNRILLSVPDRPPSTMGNPDLLALYLLLLSFITLSFGVKEGVFWKKIFYFFSLVVFTFTILITGSRAAYFGIAVGALYFLMFYPKKLKFVKIGAIILTVLAVGIIFYANTINKYPQFLEKNKLFNSVESRLSIKLITEDPRFAAWQIEWNALKAKPLLGYGPENFAVGFDKYYDPSVPYLNRDVSWWDRAHNVIFQTGIEAGLFGIISYLALFIVLFWQLNKVKHAESMAHGIQATLIAYFVALLFGFDTSSTYLIFFLIIGYSMHLICLDNTNQNVVIASEAKQSRVGVQNFGLTRRPLAPRNDKGEIKYITPLIFILFLILIIFLWQYNFVPFQINAEINKAQILSDQKQCDQAFSTMDKILSQHSFLDSYVRMEYVEFERTCSVFYPEKNLAYTKKSSELVNEAIKIQPTYTRYWIYLGTLTTTLAEQDDNPATKNNLLKQADDYLNKALQLAPKHQEIFAAKAKILIGEKKYEDAKNYSEKCIALNSGFSECYFYLALSELYLGDNAGANKNMQTAAIGYNVGSEASLVELSNAYNYTSDYQNLTAVFEKLVALTPNAVQRHSTLAFLYAKIGKYAQARQEATKVLQISPASKANVDAFLKTLP